MKNQEIVFTHENAQIIKEGNHFFIRTLEANGETLESGDFNTLDKAKSVLGIELTTEEKNRLIAEFMEMRNRILSTGNIHSWSDAPFFYVTENSADKVFNSIVKYSKYHSDWNWLMSVVDKIESLGFGTSVAGGTKGFAFAITNGLDYSFNCSHLNSKTKIEAVYNACIEFIVWYNSSVLS